MKKHLLAGLALAGALLSAPASAAVSVGDTVTCGALNLTCSASRATVGGGNEFAIELDMVGVILLADFSSGLLTIKNVDNPAFAGGFAFPDNYELYFSNETATIDFAELGDINDADGITSDNLSVNSGFLSIDLSGVGFLDSGSFQVNLNAPVTPPPTAAVPEPATWAMMILGFGVVGGALRRRKTATVRRAFA